MADLHLDFIDYKKVFKDREKRLQLINKLSFIPDKPYVKLVYYIKTGHWLNLKKPKTFSEKLNWLKLNDIHPEYANYVDKAYMKEYISRKYGEKYIVPYYGVYDKYEDIDFDSLPDKFVMKCTHDSGSTQIIKDKKTINRRQLNNYFSNRLKINTYNLGREYPYKNVKPKILIEELHETKSGSPISDIKIFCFNGKPKIIYYVCDRGIDTKSLYCDINGNKLDIKDYYKHCDNFEMPNNIDEMIRISKELSSDIKFVRIDFLVDDNMFYFGEMTFFHDGGFVRIQPEIWEKRLGSWI